MFKLLEPACCSGLHRLSTGFCIKLPSSVHCPFPVKITVNFPYLHNHVPEVILRHTTAVARLSHRLMHLQHLEMETRGQSNSMTWHQALAKQLTSSSFNGEGQGLGERVCSRVRDLDSLAARPRSLPLQICD